MIDTLKLKSNEISEELAMEIESLLTLRCAFHGGTGDELYSLSSGSLEGSFSSSVAVNVHRKDWKTFPKRMHERRPVTELVSCPPFLTVEGSVHKAMLGHNCFGGSDDLVPQVRWFLRDLEERMDVNLPSWDKWCVQRIDYSEVYDLNTFEAVSGYLFGMSHARYPRRKVIRYGSESIMLLGTTTTLKFYHKGPEFAKNGRKKLATATTPAYAQEVQEKANALLRVECTIKSKKLKRENGELPTASEVHLSWITNLYESEVDRVLKEGQSDMKQVCQNDAVHERLFEMYSERLAGVLFGTWLNLAARGEDKVRDGMKRRTYYLHRKQLADAGVSWHGTDVYVRELAYPADFRPSLSDPRRVTGEAPLVAECLMPFRAVV